MTSVEIVGAEVTRLISKLPDIDPVANPDLYSKTVSSAHDLISLGERIDLHNQHVVSVGEPEPIVTPREPSAEEYTAPVMDDPNVLPATKPEPEPEPEPAKTYSMPEVRAALAQSRKKGVNVNEFLQGLGYDNFTAVPAAKYGEVMAELEKL